jgi:lipopolysaccharide/colanic/teichoic acid biosynthesis glycosyltransferase
VTDGAFRALGAGDDLSKRLLDAILAATGLVLSAPLLLPAMALIRWQDGGPSLYLAPRVGRGGRPFRMAKLRTMVIDADRCGAGSTADDDPRVTPLGRFLRRYKFDELPALWNVLRGEMSLVGPRPDNLTEIDSTDPVDRRLLALRPGLTDMASIVFADEGTILRGQADADRAYAALIRPWKKQLGLLYVERRSFGLDLRLIVLTLVALVASRRRALDALARLLARLGAPAELRRVALRREPLVQLATTATSS